ncbi:hypothetical protein [Corynebacterium sp.]|uniref:hypothetical protein n=1 Tax=unclassified Corynebacterium TaxID=2624378 RepID=UPI002A9183A6|nr:hypothetical protein [Corynebacterium sp.]MDY5786060.1 hypothetical protein [Corynebacterium sp.]
MRNLSLATVFAAVSGFVVLWVAQWALDTGTEYRYFAAFWGLFFASAGLIDGLTHETTRAVAGARDSGRSGTANPWRFGGLLAAAVLVVGLAAGVLFMGQVVPTRPGTATGLLVFGLVSYVLQAALSGILNGSRLWDRYAALVALDSGIRLVLALIAWVAGWGLEVFLVITVIGAASWLVFLRADVRAAVDTNSQVFARRVVSAMLASGASAALITGFPAAANAAFDFSEGAAVSAIINAVILTRAPVLVPLQRFQSALVVRFVEKRERIYAALAAPLAAVLAVGAAGAAAAWLIGPVILRLAFKPEMAVAGPVLAALTFASAFMGALMITGVAVLAQERHGWYVAGWLAASVVSFALMFTLPYGVAATVIIALFAGPVAGAAVHAAGLSRSV